MDPPDTKITITIEDKDRLGWRRCNRVGGFQGRAGRKSEIRNPKSERNSKFQWIKLKTNASPPGNLAEYSVRLALSPILLVFSISNSLDLFRISGFELRI
jgi:hypothetical protein